MSTKQIHTQPGVVVSTAIVAGLDGLATNHAEGLVR